MTDAEMDMDSSPAPVAAAGRLTDADMAAEPAQPADEHPDETGFFGGLRHINRKLGEAIEPVTNALGQAVKDDLTMFNKGVPFGTNMQAAGTALTSGKSFQQARAEQRAEEDAAAGRTGIPGKVFEMGGNLAGAEALGPVAGALAPETSAAVAAARPLVRGAVVGGELGAVQGITDTAREDNAKASDYLRNASAGATAGAVTGGVLEGTIGKLVEKAPENADNWITKDIGGQGEASARTRTTDQLRKDKDDIRRVVKSDPELGELVDKAAPGHIPELTQLSGKIADKLAIEKAPKAEAYGAVAEAKPIRFGDLDAELEKAEKALPVSDRKIAREIANERNAIREGWATTDAHEIPDEAMAKEVSPGFTLGQVIDNYKGNIAKAKTPEEAARNQANIAELESAYGKPIRKYDPDTIVPPEVLRQHVTARENTAALTEDYGNATPSDRERAAKSVARPFEQFFHGHLDSAAEVSPEARAAVNAIRDSDARVSALINMKNSVSERIAAAQRAADKPMAMAFGQRGAVHRVGQKLGLGALGLPGLAIAMGHPGVAGAIALTKTAPAAKRVADKALAALIAKAATGSVGHRMVLEAIQYGVPRAVALRVASSAVGGLINDVDGGQPVVAP